MRTLAILLILCACASAFGATYPASNASYVAVSNAVALASSGDTVTVPAGTAIWTNNLTIAKNLNLIGSNTVIVKYDTTVSHQIITWNPTGSTNQLSGFIFAGLNGPHQYDGAIYLNGSCNAFRVDHCMFSNLWNVPIWISGAIFGVIDHCTIQDVQFCNSLEIKNGNYGGGSYAYGDYSWASTPNYGTTNGWLYVEDCLFHHFQSAAIDDFDNGSRLVFRHNTIIDSYFQDHGTESSQRERGGRAFEVYANTFTITNNGIPAQAVPINLRSGSGVICSNTFVNYTRLWALQTFRAESPYSPWGSANGQNPWDTNNPVMITNGTHTGATAGYLTDTNHTFTVNQFYPGYELQNYTAGGTNSLCYSIIYSNDAHNIYYLASVAAFSYMQFTNGNAYRIYQTYRNLDQIGNGSGDLIAGDTPLNQVTGLASWPQQSSEGVYQWQNTFDGVTNYAYGTNYQGYNIVLNRDYFDTNKPAYTPLIYPHPLVTGYTPPSPPSGDGSTNIPPSILTL